MKNNKNLNAKTTWLVNIPDIGLQEMYIFDVSPSKNYIKFKIYDPEEMIMPWESKQKNVDWASVKELKSAIKFIEELTPTS